MLDILVIIAMLSGLLFFVATTVGIIRFPDFYSRVHAAGKGDTLATTLFLGGTILYLLRDFSGETLLTAAKLLLIVFYIFIASPTATHAIIDAGYEFRVPYWTRSKKDNGTEGDEKKMDNGFYPEDLKG
ncbi:MAG: monovalent cation/H(+) antiporter subunit G [Desulfotignum sp.]|nr:monovalent cation/H(+) antiporter subunit G [Desulfotignum sp.]MCF8113304.1 monovalent cation/H(+) antiporter subunit G [Desulfotignum sp.]MCF8125044.1 monovalent cation/H(+) antiporter subunit G [Desulfotignum sp.]